MSTRRGRNSAWTWGTVLLFVLVAIVAIAVGWWVWGILPVLLFLWYVRKP